MRVKLTTSRFCHTPSKLVGGQSVQSVQNVGDEIDVPNDEGERLLESGQATRVKESNAGSRENRG